MHYGSRVFPASLRGFRSGGRRLAATLLPGLVALLALPAAVAAAPPVPSQPAVACGAVVSGECYVGGAFTLSSYSAGAHHYAICRSNDTTGWGGCDVLVTANTGSLSTVSGSHLPSNGYRRAYYVAACDAANSCTAWGASAPAYVRTDLTGPAAPGGTSVACAYANGDDCWVLGNFTVSAAPASDGGSGVSGYRICRSVDITGWGGCDHDMVGIGSGGTSFTVSGSHLPADGYRRAYYFAAIDRVGNHGAWNNPRFVRVDRYWPTVSATNSSTQWFTSRTAAISAADATGGAAANSGLATVRYRWNGSLDMGCVSGGTATYSGAVLTAPQGANTLYLCARDNAGRPSHWSGTYYVDAGPPTAPGPTTVACAHTAGDECWVTGDFVASVTPATDGGTGVSGYRICRSVDITGWGGCDHDMVPLGSGGTSFTVSGSHLPSDGFRRAYYFAARDGAGNWGPWNSPRFVKIDRYAPTISATNASTAWFASRTATVSAADATGGAVANSGLATVRYRWNAGLDAACVSGGTATSSGTTLTAPEGDNTLYLCARDGTGRVTHWSGTYRVDSGPPTAPGPTTVACAHTAGDECWVTGDFLASVTPATDNGAGVSGYRICRSVDITGWGGCDHDMVPPGSGGTSFTVSGSNLPGDGYRRAYYFAARDANGNWGPWNAPRFVKIDRYSPTVAGTGSSSQWTTSNFATVTAFDTTGGAAANSGLAGIRFRWNSPLNSSCTDGTAVAHGGIVPAPEGSNTLHLCARDNAGRVGTWSGPFAVDGAGPSLDSLAVSAPFWSIGDGSTYQITARATDAGSGVRELRALINLHGDNAANPRGNFSWRDQSLGYLWTGDQVPCNGGGYASKRPDAYNPDTVSLVGCSTTLSGGQRTVVFTVRPHAAFGEFGAVNDVSFWARDFLLNARGWQNFDLNFASGLRPPPVLQVLGPTGAAMADGATVAWGDVDQGAGSGVLAKTITVKNVAAAGSGNLVLEHSPSNVEITGSSAFTVGGSLTSPLAVGIQDGFNVRLDTNLVGQHSAQLKIWHNDPARPNPAVFNLSARVLAAPVVTGVTPPVILRGTSATVTVNGQFLQGASIAIGTESYEAGGSSTRVFPTAQLVSVNSAGTKLTATIDARAAGIDGFYNLSIVTPGGVTGAQFRVVGPAPVIDVWTPSEPISGRVHVLQVMGANLAGANVVPLTAGVVILDLDNSSDDGLSGLMFVSSSVPTGNLDLRIDGTGGSTILPMELQPDVQTASLATRELEVPSSVPGGIAPSILLQDPMSAHSPEELAASFGIRPKDGARSSVSSDELEVGERNHFCLTAGSRRTIRYSAILVSLFNDLGNPLTREAINALLPGQRLDFTSLTLAVNAFLQFEFFFRICENGVTDLFFCIRGGISVLVPAVGGWSVSFDVCLGFNQETNLGASGSVNSHGYSSSNGCVTANDLSGPGSILGERSGEVVMNCCENATITLHTSGVAFETPFAGEGPIIEAEPECVPPASINLRVKEVSFLDDLSVKRDVVGSANVIADPVWSDPELDGQPVVEDNAVAYVRGQSVRVTAKLVADEEPLQPTLTHVKATAPNGLVLSSAYVNIDSQETVLELTATAPLGNSTQRYAPLELQWSYTTDGATYVDAGRTRHLFFVTLAPPLAGRELTTTALSLGIGSGGATTQSEAAQLTWNQFAGPANIRTWDGRALSYYPAGTGFGGCDVMSIPLLTSPTGAGQCGSFAHLLIDALAANGIQSQFTRVSAADGSGLLIRNWSYLQASYPGTTFPWRLELVEERPQEYGMVPVPPGAVYGDLQSLSGLPGQNSPTPSEKAFARHFIVNVPVLGLSGAGYYDPSYGRSFSSEQSFQTGSVAGFYRGGFGDPAGVFRTRQPGTSTNIVFTPVP